MELPNIAAYAYQDVHVWSALLTCLRPGPPCIPPGHRRAGLLVPKLPISRFFLNFHGQEWLKTALNHLFGHSKWSRNNYGRNSFFFYPFCIHG